MLYRFRLTCFTILAFAIMATIGIFVAIAEEAKLLQGQPGPREYHAQWVWGNCEHPQPFQFMRFRKTIELGANSTDATAFITADSFYRLWINGQLVMHGPARSSLGKATVDPIKIAKYLHQGENNLMVEVWHGISAFETLSQAPGLLCELEVVVDGKREIIAPTDATWEAAEITAWNRDSIRFQFQRGWIEQYDGRKVLQEKWQPAVVLGKVGTSPWKQVEMRDVPLPAPLVYVPPTSVMGIQRGDGTLANIEPDRQDLGRSGMSPEEWQRHSEWFRRLEGEQLRDDTTAVTNPAGITSEGTGDTILQGDGASASYDLGLGYVGFLGFEITGHEGQVIEIAWNERMAGDGAVRPRSQIGNNASRYVLREGRQSFLAFMPQFARFIRIVQRGEGQIVLHRFGLTEYRFDAKPKGGFRCSDEKLNQIYDAAGRTAMLCTLDSYMDCPHRERNAMYGLEGYTLEKGLYPMFGDTSVSRRAIRHGADSANDPAAVGPPGMVQTAYPMQLPFPGIIPSGPAYWILHMGLYERCSGDTEFIREMIPAMRKNLEAIATWRTSEGLLDPNSVPSNSNIWHFFDYTDIDTGGISVGLNAFYAKALDEASRLERLAGDATHTEKYAAEAAQVRQVINQCCTGDTFYPDALSRNAKGELVPRDHRSETTQYIVMWAQIPPSDRMNRMWKALRDDFVPTPNQNSRPNHFTRPGGWPPPIHGIARGGLYPFLERTDVCAALGDHAALIRDIKAMFGPMVDSTPGTLWEDPVFEIALCHSIGCFVGGTLSEEILGIQTGFPLKITPHNGGVLQWCKGFVTTPRGRVDVEWRCQKDRYELRVSLPEGISAEVVLPPEAKAVWQLEPSNIPWQDTLTIQGKIVIRIEPGKITNEK